LEDPKTSWGPSGRGGLRGFLLSRGVLPKYFVAPITERVGGRRGQNKFEVLNDGISPSCQGGGEKARLQDRGRRER